MKPEDKDQFLKDCEAVGRMMTHYGMAGVTLLYSVFGAHVSSASENGPPSNMLTALSKIMQALVPPLKAFLPVDDQVQVGVGLLRAAEAVMEVAAPSKAETNNVDGFSTVNEKDPTLN